MTCPACRADVTFPDLPLVTVCPSCARTVAIEDGAARTATAVDVAQLSGAQVATLKIARREARR